MRSIQGMVTVEDDNKNVVVSTAWYSDDKGENEIRQRMRDNLTIQNKEAPIHLLEHGLLHYYKTA